MSSTALYKAFIEVGASEVSATRAAEDVIQVSQLPQLATKADIANLESKIEVLRSDVSADIANLDSKIEVLRSEMAVNTANLRTDMSNLETRLLKWMVGCGFLFTGIVIAGVGLVV